MIINSFSKIEESNSSSFLKCDLVIVNNFNEFINEVLNLDFQDISFKILNNEFSSLNEVDLYSLNILYDNEMIKYIEDYLNNENCSLFDNMPTLFLIRVYTQTGKSFKYFSFVSEIDVPTYEDIASFLLERAKSYLFTEGYSVLI